MSIEKLKKTFNSLELVNKYKLSYNNTSSSDVPDTVFSVSLYADKEMIHPPLFVVSEPKEDHFHIVQNASESLVRIITGIERKYIDALKKGKDIENKATFQASMLEELINHSAIFPAKGELDVVESTAMMLGALNELKNYAKEVYENSQYSKKLLDLLKRSQFAEHTRHKHGLEFVSLVEYSSGSRKQVLTECTPKNFTQLFGIKII
ncbi:hypothetical protein ACT5DM_001009 [Vibrio alginolyticus]